MSYDIDWDKLNQDATSSTSTSKYGGGEKSVFIKMKAGIHHLRIIPSGNDLEKLPYIRLMQHPVRYVKEDGQPAFSFPLCWAYVMQNLKDKQTEEDRKTKSLLVYLINQQLLNQIESDKYQQNGCPFCKAFQFLNNHSVEAETRNKFYPKDQYLFNVLWRKRDLSGDNGIYIWRVSKTQFNNIINQIRLNKFELSNNPLDTATGKDLIVQATGEGLARRYPMIQFSSVQTPLNLTEQTPHNLLTVIDTAFKPYQETVNEMKLGFGKILAHYGYTIPGDMVISQQYQNVSKVADNITQFATIPDPVPATTVRETIKPIEPTGIEPMREGDEVVYQGGKLINKRTGKEVF